jgi:hypothetical protein
MQNVVEPSIAMRATRHRAHVLGLVVELSVVGIISTTRQSFYRSKSHHGDWLKSLMRHTEHIPISVECALV